MFLANNKNTLLHARNRRLPIEIQAFESEGGEAAEGIDHCIAEQQYIRRNMPSFQNRHFRTGNMDLVISPAG